MYFSTLLPFLPFFFAATGMAGYVLEDDYFAQGFFDQFAFWDTADPTDGFVAFQNRQAAQSAGLINQTDKQVTMSVDSTNNTPNGRPSVRLTSNKSYSSGLVVADIEHMPGSICGTWPAYWMVGPHWPNGGEMDILEGKNDQTSNFVTLHTGSNCTINNNAADFTGDFMHPNCQSSNADNVGCQIASNNTNSYGTGFNTAQGGVYATEWTASAINVYFFSRDAAAGGIPADVLGDAPDPSTWGKPLASFTGDCDMATAFVDQQIIIDTTFCGSWAGATWADGSCSALAPTCEEYVQNNPAAFAEAYWAFNALKVYQNTGAGSPPTASSSASPYSSAAPSAALPSSSAPALPSSTPLSPPPSSSSSSSSPPADVSTAIATATSIVYVAAPPAYVSTALATATSIVYVAAPPAPSVATPPVPTTFAIATSARNANVPPPPPPPATSPPAAAVHPAESATPAFAPVVGAGGVVDEVDTSAPSSSSSSSSRPRQGWHNTPQGAAYGVEKRDEEEMVDDVARTNHARHLSVHRRKGGRRF